MEKMLSLEILNNVAEIDFVYRKKVNVKMSDRPRITCSTDIYNVLLHYWNQDKIELVEEFKVMYLNRSNRVLHIMPVSSGGISGTVADPRIILAMSLKLGACSVVMAHNHPSGSLKPSYADEELTLKIDQAAKFLDIRILDHLIITNEGYFSFADEGIL